MGKKLVVLDGPMKGLEFPIHRLPLYVGNDFKADVRAPLDTTIAAFHCRVLLEEGTHWVEDLATAGGTRLGGQRVVGRAALADGDVMQAGDTRFCFVDAQADRLAVLEQAGATESARALAGRESARVLLVDGDVDRALAASTLLRGHGYTVTSAADDAQAESRLAAGLPDVMVTVDRMTGIDGANLVRRLRAMPRGVLVHVVVLGVEAGPREAMVRTEADDGVTASSPSDLELRLAGALRRRDRVEASLRAASAAAPGGTAPGVHGTLDQMSLPALLSFLEMEGRSGEVILDGEGGAPARIRLRDGHAVAASVPGQNPLSGRQAVYALLRWQTGRFTFVPGTVEDQDAIRSDMTHLLLEGARLDDEQQRP